MNLKELGYRLFYLTGVVCYSSMSLFAQNEIETSIKVAARAFGDSIVLRWAPNTPTSWLALNTHGYRIERYTMVRDSVALKEKPMKVLINGIKPSELALWAPWAKDEMVAITAQAIFGKSFTLTNNKSTSIGDVINLSREQESRFSFALFACDISPKAATLAGLRWVDKEIKKNEKYLYRVYSLAPENQLKINFGYTFVGASALVKLTAPREPTIKFGNRTALLEWDANPLRDLYIGYFIERSEDGRVFKRISKLPVTPLQDENGSLRISTKIDSLPTNEVEFYYRIQGLTPFGDAGPYSSVTKGKGISPIRERGFISDYLISKQGKVLVRWRFPQEYEKEIVGFGLERGTKVDGPYKGVNKKPIDPTQRSFEDSNPSSTNYYRVVTFGKGNQKVVSHPYLIQLEDSIPPLPPGDLSAKIDTLGLVSLSWARNKEPDLAGYHVYRSNFASSEYARISRNPITQNSYQDTINLKTLTNKIYYKLTAIDNRFNPSDYSPPLIVDLPDIIPPLSPIIESIRSTNLGVKIAWNASASDDVVSYRLLRRPLNSISWDTIKVVKAQDSLLFTDRSLEVGREFQYSTVAIDKSKLKSPLSSPVTGRLIDNLIKLAVTDFKAEVDRTDRSITLRWKYNEKNVTKFLIYRVVNDEPLSLYKSVPGNRFNLKDVDVRIDTSYSYRVKVVFVGGNESTFSEPVQVKF